MLCQNQLAQKVFQGGNGTSRKKNGLLHILSELQKQGFVTLNPVSPLIYGEIRRTAAAIQAGADKAAADVQAAADKIAADKIAADKIAADVQAAADKAAAVIQAAADKIAADVQAAADKAAADVTGEVFCCCKNPSHGKMIQCENPSCDNGKWFHFGCVGLTAAPRGKKKWFCPQCTTISKRQKFT